MATFTVDPYLMKRRLINSAEGYLKPLLFTHTSARKSVVMKPPNILVYQAEDFPVCKRDCLTSVVENSLSINKYVVYRLPFTQARKDPWMDNCRLLVIPSFKQNNNQTGILPNEMVLFKEYLTKGGKILNFCQEVMMLLRCQIGKTHHDVIDHTFVTDESPECEVRVKLSGWNGAVFQMHEKDDRCKTVLSTKYGNGASEVVAQKNSDGAGEIIHCTLPLLVSCDPEKCQASKVHDKTSLIKVLLKQLGFAEAESMSLKPMKEHPTSHHCFVLCNDMVKLKKFLSSAGVNGPGRYDIKGAAETLQFIELENFMIQSIESINCEASTHIPMLYCFSKNTQLPPMEFSWEKYCSHLDSRDFGKIVLYSDIVTSTMDIVEPLVGRMCSGNIFSVCCIARQQTKGKGRGGNKWLSPPGTGMFTLAFSIPLQSSLGRHLSVTQHLVTVAVVHAVRSIPALSTLDLRVKWPNDIYIGSDVKIGGVLVKSTIYNDRCIVTIGCGVNVSNEVPTRCINDLIKAGGFASAPLTCEEVMARSISCLEKLVDVYQRDGASYFLDLYYKYWIHSNQIVKVQNRPQDRGSVTDARITSIDESGFLRVVVLSAHGEDAREISLQPDSNSFDMTKNLIAIKS